MIFKRLLSKIYCKKNKYLEEAGISTYPANHWGGIDSFKSLLSARRSLREKRRTGIDPRECWDMDTSLYEWVYSNLCQLLKDTNADLSFHKFTFKNKTYTEEEFINYLKDLCLKLINFDEFEGCPPSYDPEVDDDSFALRELSDEEKEEFMRVYKENGKKYNSLRKEFCNVLYKLLPHLWW